MSGSGGGSEAISPTAHYTGHVWARNGLSHPALDTLEGRALYESLRPLMALGELTLGVSLEPFLLARHRAIDRLLETAIEAGTISQVVEVAAGLSARGWRFHERYGERIVYIETDLPGMTARKRRALERIGSLSPQHRVLELDALRERGPGSLAELAGGLDRARGLVIITEGLLSYLDAEAMRAMWRRFAATLSGHPDGRYLSDLHLSARQNALVRLFRLGLAGFVRGRVELHFAGAGEAEAALGACGFAAARVRPAATHGWVSIIEASTTFREASTR